MHRSGFQCCVQDLLIVGRAVDAQERSAVEVAQCGDTDQMVCPTDRRVRGEDFDSAVTLAS